MVEAGRVGIVAALAAEARTLGRAVGASDGPLLAVSGMGLGAAERSARALIEAGCRALVSWGLAGGLDPRVPSGRLVVPERLILDGAPELRVHSLWHARVLEMLDAFKDRSYGRLPVEAGGKLLTNRGPLASIAAKRTAFLQHGAVAVDMESYAIAAVAAAHRLPFIAIRVIVDAADDEVPAAVLDAADARGRVAAGRLLVRMLGSPRSLAPLLALARRYGAARRALRAAARAGAPGPAPVADG